VEGRDPRDSYSDPYDGGRSSAPTTPSQRPASARPITTAPGGSVVITSVGGGYSEAGDGSRRTTGVLVDAGGEW
jgi:hypothetical protein